MRLGEVRYEKNPEDPMDKFTKTGLLGKFRLGWVK
jgi:hypothetical protein